MPKKKEGKPNIFKKLGIIGLLTIALINPLTLSRLTYNGEINDVAEKFAIWSFDLFVLIASIYLIKNSRKVTWKKIALAYTYLAVTLLTVATLFLISVALLFTGLKIANIFKEKTNPVSIKYNVDLTPLYPGMAKDEINQLLHETWSRPVSFEAYTLFKESPYQGKYVNISSNGYRLVKDQGPWPLDKEALNIFVFGGSTTFGYGVADDQTIPSFLGELTQNDFTSKKIYVYNFGRGAYFSAQERILFEKLLSEGFVPNMAVFIDGINDFARDDDPYFSNQISQLLTLRQHPAPLSALEYFALRLIGDDSYQLNQTIKRFEFKSKTDSNGFEIFDQKYSDETRTQKIIIRYLANKKIIESSAKSFGVETVFVWQPSPAYNYNLKNHPFSSLGFDENTYAHFGYGQVKDKYDLKIFGDNFLWLADMQKDMNEPLYVDKIHYTPKMNEMIAQHISNFLKTRYTGN